MRAIWTEPLPDRPKWSELPQTWKSPTLTFGMEDLAEAGAERRSSLDAALRNLPRRIRGLDSHPASHNCSRISASRRVETAGLLREAMTTANAAASPQAISASTLAASETCRRAFGLMNRAMAQAARQRIGYGAQGNAPETPRSADRGGRSNSPSSCSTSTAWPTALMPIARSSTCCSSPPAAARPRPI